jgi:Tfp pilus assembly PilM family ATPase
MRCALESVVLVEIDSNGVLLSAQSYDLQTSLERNNTEEWLQAFAKTLVKIPKKIRSKITLVVPPNGEVFIRHLKIPDLTEKSALEAFKYECEHEFPGGAEEWCWDIYQARDQANHAFGIAIRRAFAERLIDILISNKVQFSHICPDILLTAAAMLNCTSSPTNSMLVHIGEASSYLACIGNGIEYFRSLPIAGLDLDKIIAESQKLSLTQAEALQMEFLRNPENENRAFMTYYIKQFAQKLRQELKKSELFYCRTFKQDPTTKLCLTGSRSKLYEFFKPEENMEIVDVFEVLKNSISGTMKQEEIDLLKPNIGTFVGAAYCLKNKQTKLLNLFSENFSNQVEFQRQHLGYLLFLVLITLLALTGLKILKKDIISLETQKNALKAKLFEINVDIDRYDGIGREWTKLHDFIKNNKQALRSQLAWAEFFSELQNKVETLQTAWIEALSWTDWKEKNESTGINIAVKLLLLDEESRKSAGAKVEDFILSLSQMKAVNSIDNVRLAPDGEYSLLFSFDVTPQEHSDIFTK